MKFLSDLDNAAALVADMVPDDRADYRAFGHNRLESAFVERVFIVYECLGRTSNDIQRPPRIITTLRVTNVRMTFDAGVEVQLLDEVNNRSMWFGHVPKRLFDFPLFASTPPRMTIKWDAQFMGDKLVRSLLFAILIKSRNKASFLSKNNIYAETPNTVRDLFPHVEMDLKT